MSVRPLPWILKILSLKEGICWFALHANVSSSEKAFVHTDMMSQRSALTSLFADDPFFSQERLLWPLHLGALSSLQRDFFDRRGKLADSLLRELHDGPPSRRLGQLPLLSPAGSGYVQKLTITRYSLIDFKPMADEVSGENMRHYLP